MSALFILATAGLVFNVNNIVNQLLWKVASLSGAPNSELPLDPLILGPMTPQYIMMLLSNIITDAILIWTCYIVWGGNIRAIILPTLLCIANNILGIVVTTHYCEYFEFTIIAIVFNSNFDSSIQIISAFLIMTALTNLLITFSIAGRIYIISHKAAKYVGKNVNKMYWTVITIVLESGLMYPLQIAYAILGSAKLNNVPHGASAVNFESGIAPTLIIVHTGLGISVESVEQMVSTMHAAAVTESKQSTENIVDILPLETGGRRFNDSVYSEDISAKVKVTMDVERT
uniref:Uncharacterized protein n=1 Tax=Moniliophthora roreri TaxID=221103 RepID=A0A0W0EVJ5_MONRR